MGKRIYDCQRCSATFPTLSEHAIHVSLTHLPGQDGPSRRTISCWSCAGEFIPTVNPDGSADCPHCGFHVPPKVNAPAPAGQ